MLPKYLYIIMNEMILYAEVTAVFLYDRLLNTCVYLTEIITVMNTIH